MKEEVKKLIQKSKWTETEINELVEELYNKHPQKHNPVCKVLWVPIVDVEPNDYNPNAVAMNELKLLEISIDQDGYTQPIVTIWDDKKKKYIIIDGFHRYYVCKTSDKINKRNNGHIPIVVLDKDINQRMASTVRHNRARGKHSINGMGHLVIEMIKNGKSDAEICNELGLEVEELVRLKYTSGIAKMFEDVDFSYSAKTINQLEIEYDPTKEEL